MKYFYFMIHIGHIIRDVVKEKGLSVTEFGRRINTHRRNVYDIFERQSVDTSLLIKIGKVLGHDFFSYYYQNSEEEELSLSDTDIEYNRKEKSGAKLTTLVEKINSFRKEVKYLKQLVADKEKIIEMLENRLGNENG